MADTGHLPRLMPADQLKDLTGMQLAPTNARHPNSDLNVMSPNFFSSLNIQAKILSVQSVFHKQGLDL